MAINAQLAIAGACSAVLSLLQQANLVRADADMAYEAERLHALVDGLALHALTTEAKDLRPKEILGCSAPTWPRWSRAADHSSAAASQASSRDSLRPSSSPNSMLSSPSLT